MAANTEEYYKSLLGPTEAEIMAEAAGSPKPAGGLLSKLKGVKGLKGAGAQTLGFLILQRLLNLPAEAGERNVQREAIRAQGASMTPENLYYQAALPQAQEEESQARQALFSQLSGGVIGPSLPRGYRVIGG
jgi:hypothetical protein